MSGQADWDIVTGVGLTALAVAAGRSIETGRPDRLMADPYAEAFVRAARSPIAMPTGPDAVGEWPWEAMATYMGVRSRFFDVYFADATAAGVTQVVLLAAGLDTRSYRLAWPPGAVVYELDAPKVLGFKAQVLAEEGARPRCRRRAVEADLRENWPAALLAAGFERDRPVAWLAEGLLPFLPDDATAQLFAHIDDLSVPGSRLAAEHLEGDAAALVNEPPFDTMAEEFGFDVAAMWPAGQRYDPVRALSERGWKVTAEPAADAATRYRRPLDPQLTVMQASRLITARRMA